MSILHGKLRLSLLHRVRLTIVNVVADSFLAARSAWLLSVGDFLDDLERDLPNCAESVRILALPRYLRLSKRVGK